MGNDRVLAITWLVTPRQPGRGVRGGSGLGVMQIMTQIKATFEWIWVSQLWGEQGQSKIKGGRRSEDTTFRGYSSLVKSEDQIWISRIHLRAKLFVKKTQMLFFLSTDSSMHLLWQLCFPLPPIPNPMWMRRVPKKRASAKPSSLFTYPLMYLLDLQEASPCWGFFLPPSSPHSSDSSIVP